jgi:hypothetical protein
MKTEFTLKRTFLFATLLLLFFNSSNAQSWAYVDGTCCLDGGGSSEIIFKSDGTPVVASFTYQSIKVRQYDGTAWVTLTAPAVSGIVGWFDLEIHNDELYMAVINNGMKVYKYDGTAWVQLGATLSGSFGPTSFDFAIDNAGTAYVVNGGERKIHKYDGTAWAVIYTFPATSGSTIFGYNFVSDNTMFFDANNHMHYVVNSNDRQFMKKFDGTTETLVGDTIHQHEAFSPYGVQVYQNNGEIYAAFNRIFSTPFIKKLNGSTWQVYGDTTGMANLLNNSLLAFNSSGSLYYTATGNIGRVVYEYSSSSSPFTALDSISHNGFCQLTDIEVNPVTGKLYAAFNELNDKFGVMIYNGSSIGIEDMSTETALSVYPNPSTDVITINSPAFNSTGSTIEIFDLAGKKVSEQKLSSPQVSISHLPNGLYIGKITGNSNHIVKFSKQ